MPDVGSVTRFEPRRWAVTRARGRLAFVFRHGLPIGLALAAILDTVRLFMTGNGDLALSVWRIPRLALSMAVFGPMFGAAVGQLLWDRGENRYRKHLLKEAFRADDAAVSS